MERSRYFNTIDDQYCSATESCHSTRVGWFAASIDLAIKGSILLRKRRGDYL